MVTSLVIGGAILGLLIGSFINVVAYRIPNGISVITPPSACPACAHEIRPRDNVPVLGWLLLRGRCRDCAELISVRYPIVEAATAVLFALTPVVVGAVWAVPAYWWFVGVTVTLVLTDLDYTRIPNRILYPGTIVATVLLAIGAGLDDAWSAFGRAVAGGAGYFVLLLAIALIARGGFGFGDVKLAFLLGEFAAFRSWDSLFVGVFAAFVVGGLVSIVLLALGSVGRKDAIPFGPAMVAGAYIGITAGVAVVDWYLG